MLGRGLVAEPQGPEDWEITEITTWGDGGSGAGGPIAANFISGQLCVGFNLDPDKDLAFATCGNTQPAGPGDWQILLLDTTGNAGNQIKLRSVGGCPLVGSYSSDGVGTSYLRLARALVPAPDAMADWSLSTPASGGPYFAIGSLGIMDAEVVIIAFDHRANGYSQLLACYPPYPGVEALDQPWTIEEINPDLLDDNSVFPETICIDGWIINMYSDRDFVGEDLYLKCAVANMPARYVK